MSCGEDSKKSVSDDGDHVCTNCYKQMEGEKYASTLIDFKNSHIEGLKNKALVGETITFTAVVQPLIDDSTLGSVSLTTEVHYFTTGQSSTSQDIVIKKIIDSNNYEVSYVPRQNGDHMISVMVEGHHLSGSPFKSTAWLRNYVEFEERSYHVVTNQEIKDPYGIAAGPNNEIALLNYSQQVVVFEKQTEKDLKLTNTFAFKADGKILKPYDIAVGDSIIAVSDWSNNVVKMFKLNGVYQHTIGSSKGTKDGQFNSPFGLAFNSKRILYVVDSNNYRVQAFDTSNNNIFCGKFGSKGSGPGQFSYAAYVAVDSQDLIYVTDYNNSCINIFAADGDHEFLGKIDSTHPWPIAFTPDDYMLVADYRNNRLNVFSPPQQFSHKRYLITEVGTKGSSKSKFNYISGIAVNKEGIIYIAEYNNKRLQYISI